MNYIMTTYGMNLKHELLKTKDFQCLTGPFDLHEVSDVVEISSIP